MRLSSGLSKPNSAALVEVSDWYFTAFRLPSAVRSGCAFRNGIGAVNGPLSFQFVPSLASLKLSPGVSLRVISTAVIFSG